MGEGLVGQCALEKERILLTNVPPEYIQISSGLGEAAPLNIVVLPVVFENQVKAVIELGSFDRFTEVHLTFLEQLTESIGIVLNTISATTRTEDLLKQSQSLTEELRSQQEELTETNKRLEQQAKTLQQSEELLKNKQKELQMANESLEERADLLSEQKNEVERKNHEVERAKQLLEEKASQLALTSKFKSEFLANMSHELRTPLNSLLILAKVLSENDGENLNSKQVEYAQTIYSSGTDLLELINDILDLAKIESGTVAVDIGNVSFVDIQNFIDRGFSQVAKSKHLTFAIELDSRLPVTMHTDSKRLYQVLKNLLSNAFKFTEKGGVTLSIRLATEGWTADHIVLNQAKNVVQFMVTDSGIGIPKDKHRIIFEAFQQADGTTSRKYGGTGLGLSISRQIVYMLGGDIQLQSIPDEGSTFSLYLPIDYVPVTKRSKLSEGLKKSNALIAANDITENEALIDSSSSTSIALLSSPQQKDSSLVDIKETIQPDDLVLLIIGEDISFVQSFLKTANECGFKAVITHELHQALALSHEFNPAAILLDLQISDNEGWTILDRLKHNVKMRHIPVCVTSRIKEEQDRAFKLGAINFLQKPLTEEVIGQAIDKLKNFIVSPIKKILIVEKNKKLTGEILEYINIEHLQVNFVDNVKEARELLQSQNFDCLAANVNLLGLDKTSSKKNLRLLLGKSNQLPQIIYVLNKVSKTEEAAHLKITKMPNVKLVKSFEFLINEMTSILHLPLANLPKATQRMLNQIYRIDLTLSGKKVLIIDDDIRNIFALISALERHQIQAIYTENGKEGIKMLHDTPDIDVILMDIMMPEMDGYETIRTIRQFEQFNNLPIVALTAKAMQGDREKCIKAGASSYLPKPVNIEHLLSILRICLV